MKELGAPRDFIDAYLQILDDDNRSTDASYYSGIAYKSVKVLTYYKDWNNKLQLILTEEQLIGMCFDFFVAGVTTTHALSFALLLMIKYPQVQTKVQNEIDEVFSSTPPKLIDRSGYSLSLLPI